MTASMARTRTALHVNLSLSTSGSLPKREEGTYATVSCTVKRKVLQFLEPESPATGL